LVDARVHQHRHRAGLEQREHQQEELRRGPHHHHRAAAAHDPAGGEPGGDGVAATVELAVGQGVGIAAVAARVAHGDAVGIGGGQARQGGGDVADGIHAPIIAAPPPRGAPSASARQGPIAYDLPPLTQERPPMSLFERLKSTVATDWNDYVDHAFVRGLGDGSLPQAAFRNYLVQDYLFLIQFARAHALAAYKSRTLADMQAARGGLGAILDEMGLHLRVCERWGLSAADVEATEEQQATVAYTRFVLDVGMSGDLLDLQVALIPCTLGYAEIGRRLTPDG